MASGGMKSASREFLAAVLTALASVTILVTLLAHYANHVLVNPASFSRRAVSVVHTGPVESLIADSVTDRLVKDVGDETSVQPMVEDAVSEALRNGEITAEIRAAAKSLQSELVSGTASTLKLTLPDVGPATASRIESRSPELADALTHVATIAVLDVPIPSTAADAVHDVASVGRDSSLLLVLSVALVILALLISEDRGRTLLWLGLGTFMSGLLAAVVYLVGHRLVVNEFSAEDARTAAGTVWSVYLGGLETSGFVLAGVGAVIMTAAALI